MRRRYPASRAGITILEVGITVTLSVLLVSLAVVMLSTLLQTQRHTLERDRLRREYARLETIWRRDVHAATAAKVVAPGDCELKDTSGNSWNYQASEAGLVRTYLKQGQLKQREVFHWPRGTSQEFQLVPAGDRAMLQLRVDPPQVRGPAPSRRTSFHGKALVGGGQPPSALETES